MASSSRSCRRLLASYPDGSPRRVVFDGALIIRLTNTDNGKFDDVDVSGSAIVDYFPDGSQTWYVFGPAMFGFRTGAGNSLPRGFYLLDGLYRREISPTFVKTLTMVFGTKDNICDHLV